MKSCTKCGEEKELTEFWKNKRLKSGYKSACKACLNAERTAWGKKNPDKDKAWGDAWRATNRDQINEDSRNRQRGNKRHHSRVRAVQAGVRAPAWRDSKAIADFYEARPADMHVDHIIPLKGTTVSGLHVLANLQYLAPSENIKKGNTWQSHE